MQRRVVAVVGLAVLFSLSGCVAALTGDTIRFEADSAIIAEDTADELEYNRTQYNATTISRTVEVAGQEREIVLRTWQAVYTRTEIANETALNETIANETAANESFQNESAAREELAEEGAVSGSLVTVVSTPDAQVLGQSVSPLARLSNEQLIETFGSQAGGAAEDLAVVDRTNLTMLGTETELTIFEGSGRSGEGGNVESRFYVAKVPHEGDVVILVGIHPQGMTEERERIETAVGNIEHPVDSEPPEN